MEPECTLAVQSDSPPSCGSVTRIACWLRALPSEHRWTHDALIARGVRETGADPKTVQAAAAALIAAGEWVVSWHGQSLIGKARSEPIPQPAEKQSRLSDKGAAMPCDQGVFDPAL